ncbi:MAG: 6-phosphogluconolactonase [Planctomycetes bacterium]|nr:6-phosphogluconolactonase [Planctomycetota bacterium]
MKIRRFERCGDLEREALALLVEHLGAREAVPHAVMLTGGRTPIALYERLTADPPEAGPQLHILLSDERHVPLDSPDSNYAKIAPLVDALGLEPRRVLRARTDLPLSPAAERYDGELRGFVGAGGGITLAILGLGADGHVASLFGEADIRRGEGRWAIAVPRAPGPDRISVTHELLRRAERIVFLVAGEEKRAVVERVEREPESVIAARALAGAPRVEIWFAGESPR